MALQLLVPRAVARTFAKNEKKESSSGSLGRFLYSLVRQLGGEVEENSKTASSPVPEIDTIRVRRRSLEERNNDISTVRRILLDGLLRRVTSHQASQIRRKTFDQNSAPFLALVGVSQGWKNCLVSP